MRILFILTILLLTSCGGGGGGDDSFVGAANTLIDISPNEIDTGDRAQVIVRISDVNTSGIILKILYPESLGFVSESASLEVDNNEDDLDPDVIVTGDDGRYAVFFISSDDIPEDKEGRLSFVLEANDTLSEGTISVDADVDDPLINNNVEFDIEQPEFLAEDSEDIRVIG